MPRPAEPISLIKAKGKKHLTKKETEERESRELKVPFVDIKPPEYLSAKQQEKFDDIAGKLRALDIMTELDIDCLARYVLAHDMYLAYTAQVTRLIKNKDLDKLRDAQNLQDKAFKQAQSAARDLGLTITSRCKIVVPAPPEDDDEL